MAVVSVTLFSSLQFERVLLSYYCRTCPPPPPHLLHFMKTLRVGRGKKKSGFWWLLHWCCYGWFVDSYFRRDGWCFTLWQLVVNCMLMCFKRESHRSVWTVVSLGRDRVALCGSQWTVSVCNCVVVSELYWCVDMYFRRMRQCWLVW